jgi:hypothetical protein
MYCYLVANVIIFPLRCFYKNGYFSKNTDFFQHFPKNKAIFQQQTRIFTPFSGKTSQFFTEIPKIAIFGFSAKQK